MKGRVGVGRWNARFLAVCVIPLILLVLVGGHATAKDASRIPDEATAITLDGKTVSLADHKGKLVFLIIWRTDCMACLFEIPILNRIQKEYSSENFTVIGLSMDRGKDKYVVEVAKKAGIAYPVWLGYGQPISSYADTPVLPFLLAIGPDGGVLGYLAGAFPTYEHGVSAIKQARILIEEQKRTK